MNIEIINTGSELMLGRVLNTHQQWLCRRLADLGHITTRQVAVADAANEIQQAVRESLGRADLVITTGGLGPTSDDLTRELIAALLGKKLIENSAVLAHFENFFARRNRPRPARTNVETLVPEGATVFLNQYGTAPGLAIMVAPNPYSAANKPAWLIMLPGPPRELRPMFDQSVLPFLQGELTRETFVCRTLRSTGIGESIVLDMVEGQLAVAHEHRPRGGLLRAAGSRGCAPYRQRRDCAGNRQRRRIHRAENSRRESLRPG